MSHKRKTSNLELSLSTKRTRRVRGKRGALEGMPEMPLDVLFEIFRYLMPTDLLNLSRTTEVFRQFLTAHEAIPFWKIARKNIEDLPDCPSHLSEPAYAKLAFDTHCDSCNKPNIRTVFWALGVRYCPACRKVNLIRCTKRDCSNLRDDGLDTSAPEGSSRAYHWHRVDQLPSDVRRYFEDPNDRGKEMYKLKIQTLMEWARECELWKREVPRKKKERLLRLKNDRLQSIVTKLRELGWSDELDRMHPNYPGLRWQSSVHQHHVLTERAWDNIRPSLVEYMDSVRRNRLQAERKDALTTRCRQFQSVYAEWYLKQIDKHFLPRAIDLMYRRDVRALIEQANEHQVSRADFEALKHCFAEWSADWKAECDEKLRKLVSSSPAFQDKIPTNVDPLSLARVVFTCKRCKCELSDPDNAEMLFLYPAVLAHDCLYSSVWNFALNDPFEYAAVSASRGKNGFGMHTLWSCELLEVDSWVQYVEKIIKALGRNPMTATRDGMDEVDDARVYCYDCPSDSPYRRNVMTWRHALRHQAIHRAEKPSFKITENCDFIFDYRHEPLWANICDEDTLRVVRQKEVDFNVLIADTIHHFPGPWYNCAHCVRGDYTPTDLFKHLIAEHGKADPAQQDYFRSADADMCIIRPTMLLHPSIKEVLPDELQDTIDEGRSAEFDFWVSAPGPTPFEF